MEPRGLQLVQRIFRQHGKETTRSDRRTERDWKFGAHLPTQQAAASLLSHCTNIARRMERPDLRLRPLTPNQESSKTVLKLLRHDRHNCQIVGHILIVAGD